MQDYLTSEQAAELVQQCMKTEGRITSTQELLDSGAVPRLKGYVVRPGKVSDSIFGGKGSFYDKNLGKEVEFENPPLNSKEGIPLRLMVRTERISTHDVNRGVIPFKDQILAINHNTMRKMLQYAIGTSQFEVEGLADNAVVIAAEDLEQIGFENVLRAYMAKSTTSTSLYQAYIKGAREFCGHSLPEGLIANCQLPYVMDTPSTKSDEHDESVSPKQMIARGICTQAQYLQIRNSSLFAFGMVHQFFAPKGILPVDTKTEHGMTKDGRIVSQDEIWTMDSSRFWLLDDYNEQMAKLKRGEIPELNPKSYSKEFARGFSEGDKGYTDEQKILIAVRYIEGIQHLLGKRFEPDMSPRDQRVLLGLETIVRERVA